jgi:hypothetical protein
MFNTPAKLNALELALGDTCGADIPVIKIFDINPH